MKVNRIVKHFDISGTFLDRLRWQKGRLRLKQTTVKAVNDVSFEIYPGEIFSIVGESGCGKSTLARTCIGLHSPDSGSIVYRGERIDHLPANKMMPYRKKIQMIFQDPYASLNPRLTVRRTLEEPARFHFGRNLSQKAIRERVEAVMHQVGVDPKWANRYPHEFSGGQRQRVSIARALMIDPEFIIADEPVSALDVSIQAQILNLLMDARENRGLTYMIITHDLSVVAHISSRVAVMYLGTLCELASPATLFKQPLHPYTRALFSAIPKLNGRKGARIHLKGEITTPLHLPSGCVFHLRCPYTNDRCRNEVPMAVKRVDESLVACHGVEEKRIV